MASGMTFFNLPGELREMTYCFLFSQIPATAPEYIRQRDRPDDDYLLIPISSLHPFINFCFYNESVHRETWRLSLEDFLPLHGYAAHSLPELVSLVQLPQLLPVERQESGRHYTERRHEVRLSAFGAEMGWWLFWLFCPFVDEDDLEIAREVHSEWRFKDIDRYPQDEGVDDDLEPTNAAGDVDCWIVDVGMKKDKKTIRHFKMKVWPDTRSEIYLRGKLAELEWDFTRLCAPEADIAEVDARSTWTEARSLAEEVMLWFEDDDEIQTDEENCPT